MTVVGETRVIPEEPEQACRACAVLRAMRASSPPPAWRIARRRAGSGSRADRDEPDLFAARRRGSGDHNWAGSWRRSPAGCRACASTGWARSARSRSRHRGVVAGDGGLYYSDDFGDTWAPLSLVRDVRALVLSRWRRRPTVFVGTGTGCCARATAGGPSARRPSGRRVHRLEWPGGRSSWRATAAADHRDEGGVRGPGKGCRRGRARDGLSSFFLVDPSLRRAGSEGYSGPRTGARPGRRPGCPASSWATSCGWAVPVRAGSAVLPQPGRGRELDEARREPGAATRLMFRSRPPRPGGFLATDRGLFRTADAGEHWSPAASPPGGLTSPPSAPEDPPGKKRR